MSLYPRFLRPALIRPVALPPRILPPMPLRPSYLEGGQVKVVTDAAFQPSGVALENTPTERLVYLVCHPEADRNIRSRAEQLLAIRNVQILPRYQWMDKSNNVVDMGATDTPLAFGDIDGIVDSAKSWWNGMSNTMRFVLGALIAIPVAMVISGRKPMKMIGLSK